MTFYAVNSISEGFLSHVEFVEISSRRKGLESYGLEWQRMLIDKVKMGEISEAELLNNYNEDGVKDKEAPPTLKSSPSLTDDVSALGVLFSPLDVPVVNVRC